MPPLFATTLYTSLLALLALVLAINVILHRRRQGVALGTGGHEPLERAIRAHANLVEHAPLAVALVALYELGGGNLWVLHIAAASLVVGRHLHAWSLLRGIGAARVAGMAMTFGCYMLLIPANLIALALKA